MIVIVIVIGAFQARSGVESFLFAWGKERQTPYFVLTYLDVYVPYFVLSYLDVYVFD